MAFSRRRFVQTLGVGAAGALTSRFIGGRGLEALRWGGLEESVLAAGENGPIILSSNENPLGPGEKVLSAVRAAMGADGAGPGRYPANAEELAEAIAAKFKVKKENVLLGCGSTQILRTATQVFTAKTRPLVGSLPTYEECAGYAQLIGSPVRATPLDSKLRMDLDATVRAAQGAGMVFYCNPNNPTATLHTPSDTRDFIQKVLARSPETTFLVDEAYFDYVTEPHETLVPMAVENPRVVVARTFSKAYGMAGLRVGYAIGHVDTIKQMADWESGGSVSILSYAAAIAAIQQDASFTEKERERNRAARDYTRGFFKQMGYQDTECQTNFLFVDVRRPIQQFQEACRAEGILVGRPFPPLLTYARISIGTLQEMQRATEVFKKVLERPVSLAAA
jgi:histidinol-phosphate aminotransferase